MGKMVEITEVGLRDGFQAEAKFISTADKISLANALADAGVKRIEFSSFVAPKAIPQLRDAGDVLAGIERKPGVTLAALVPNKRGALNAAEAGVDEMVVFLSASESHNLKNVNKSVAESLNGFEDVVKVANDADIPVHGDIATAFGCPFEGNVSADALVAIASRYRDMGMKGVTLGDTTGMATPPIVTAACEALQSSLPGFPIILHFHNTRGIGLANVMAGLDAGVFSYESSFAGIGGCPFAPKATGNICTEDLIFLLKELGYETGIDLDKLIAIAHRVEDIVGRPLPGQVMRAGDRLQLHPLDEVPTARG